MGETSEMAKIRNMHWWTVEYGLIGSLENPKIYGAGLLSSIGESNWCMSNKVHKEAYTIEASNMDFDITKPQPQLFVTPNFAHLSMVLEEFANTMALRNGGLIGIKKLIDLNKYASKSINRAVLIRVVLVWVIRWRKKVKIIYSLDKFRTNLDKYLRCLHPRRIM